MVSKSWELGEFQLISMTLEASRLPNIIWKSNPQNWPHMKAHKILRNSQHQKTDTKNTKKQTGVQASQAAKPCPFGVGWVIGLYHHGSHEGQYSLPICTCSSCGTNWTCSCNRQDRCTTGRSHQKYDIDLGVFERNAEIGASKSGLFHGRFRCF